MPIIFLCFLNLIFQTNSPIRLSFDDYRQLQQLLKDATHTVESSMRQQNGQFNYYYDTDGSLQDVPLDLSRKKVNRKIDATYQIPYDQNLNLAAYLTHINLLNHTTGNQINSQPIINTSIELFAEIAITETNRYYVLKDSICFLQFFMPE